MFPGARLADGHVIGASYTGLPVLCSHSESSGLRVSALSLRSFLRNVPRGLPQGLVWLQRSRTLRWLKSGIVYACEPGTALPALERPADEHRPCHLAGGGCRQPCVAPANVSSHSPRRRICSSLSFQTGEQGLWSWSGAPWVARARTGGLSLNPNPRAVPPASPPCPLSTLCGVKLGTGSGGL